MDIKIGFGRPAVYSSGKTPGDQPGQAPAGVPAAGHWGEGTAHKLAQNTLDALPQGHPGLARDGLQAMGQAAAHSPVNAAAVVPPAAQSPVVTRVLSRVAQLPGMEFIQAEPGPALGLAIMDVVAESAHELQYLHTQ